MKSKNEQQEVLAWIEGGCDYDSGAMLYARIGKNQSLKKLFPGRKFRYSGKLLAELCKSVGINKNNLHPITPVVETKKAVFVKPKPNQPAAEPPKPFNGKMVPMVPKPAKVETTPPPASPEPDVELPETLGVTNVAEYPAVMRRVIMEYADTFQERSQCQRIMSEMPESNAEKVKAKRKELFDLVKKHTGRLEQLYEARQKYEADGTLPNEELLWPKPPKKVETHLPDTADDLKKMKKNLQSANTKDQNMLDYQTEKKGQFKNPMPAGSKRMKLENRIKGRVKLIEAIDFKLVAGEAI